MSTGGKQYDWEFFLAHAGPDAPAAERLYDLLSPHARAFLSSKSLSLGDLWDDALPRAQQSSLITVVLISPRTEQAWYQREEIAAAVDLARRSGQRVVPVYLGDATREEDVPYGLRRLHSARISSEADLKKLAQDLLALAAKQAPIPGGASPPSTAPGAPAPDFSKGVPVFLLAAREDKKAVDMLRKHLYLAKREGLMRFWSTTDVELSTVAATEIKREFDQAALILLFVSADLLPEWDDPDTVPKLPDKKPGEPGEPLRLVEMALERFRQSTARVVPILLTKFVLAGSKLSELVPLPRERGAVSEWRDQDAAWASIAKELRELALKIKGR